MQLIGVDAGGTFTDCVVATDAGQLAVGKALSTPGALEEGVLASLADAAAHLGVSTEELLAGTDVLAHGTTVGLNALLTGTGAKVGLITTAGFESTLAIAKANKVHGLSDDDLERATRWNKPALLVPRHLTRGVAGRIDAHGAVLEDFDVEDARRGVAELAAEGVNSVAVALLWSVANPRHEHQTAEVVRAALPDAHLALSSDLVPRIGEYERTATVVVDAYIGPLVSSYLAHLEERLRGLGFTGLFVLMRMGGGVHPGRPGPAHAGAHAALGPGRRRGRSQQARRPARSPEHHHHRRRRHQLRRRAGHRRRGPLLIQADDRAPRPGHPGRRCHLDRYRRREHRLDRRAPRRPAGGAGQRRRHPRTGLLRPGRHQADGHRCGGHPRLRRPSRRRNCASTGTPPWPPCKATWPVRSAWTRWRPRTASSSSPASRCGT